MIINFLLLYLLQNNKNRIEKLIIAFIGWVGVVYISVLILSAFKRVDFIPLLILYTSINSIMLYKLYNRGLMEKLNGVVKDIRLFKERTKALPRKEICIIVYLHGKTLKIGSL